MTFIKFAVSALIPAAFSMAAVHSPPREFRSSLGVAQVSLGPRDAAEGADSSFNLDTVATLSSFRNLALPDDALLLINFLDRYSGEEIRFPVKVSQISAFLRYKAGGYRSGSAEEKIVAFVRDLSRSLRVRMKAPSASGSK